MPHIVVHVGEAWWNVLLFARARCRGTFLQLRVAQLRMRFDRSVIDAIIIQRQLHL